MKLLVKLPPFLPARIVQLAGTTCFAVALVMLANGCAMQGVEATNRGTLAKAVMQRDADPHHAALEAHAYSSKENTSGGYGVGGGGCGCN